MAIPKVIVLSEIMRGKSFELTKEIYTIGRSEERDICIPDGTISSHHCDLIQNDDGFEVQDHGSTNGTRINGIRISNEKLCNSDILQVGGIELLFDCEEKANTTAITTQTSISLDQIDGDFKIGDLKSISNIGSGGGTATKGKGLWYGIIAVLVIVAFALLYVIYQKFGPK